MPIVGPWFYIYSTLISWELETTHSLNQRKLPNQQQTETMDNRQEESLEESKGSLWKIIYTSFVLLNMFVALISDRVGADMVMMVALTLLMASKIISIKEGLDGFANEGLLTVLVLFVVAAGISHTGALVSIYENVQSISILPLLGDMEMIMGMVLSYSFTKS